MNVYAVCIPEERCHYSWEEPPEVGVPVGIFVAETPAQAKRDALKAWLRSYRSGVNGDDYPAIRARKIGVTTLPRGEASGDEWWLEWPEGWPVIEGR